MKNMRYAVLLMAMLCVCGAQAKRKQKDKPVYAFGLSISLSEQVAYRTEIQQLDSAVLDANHFLQGRDQYSYQLKNYLEDERGLSNRTCMIYFNQDAKKLTKELNKVLLRLKKDETPVQVLGKDEFSFSRPEF